MTNKNLDGTIIFDNGGGITLQLPDFAHYYGGYDGCIEQAAEDLKNYLQDGKTDGWEGHEAEAADLDPDYDEIRNGGYRVYSVSAILDECKNNETTSWHNIDAFCIELADLLK